MDDAWCRCKVSGDLEARASAEHPPGTPLWSVFNCGYRREQDAVWAATRFRHRKRDDSSRAGSSVAIRSKGKDGSSSPATDDAAAAAAASTATSTTNAAAPSPVPPGDRKGGSVTVDANHPPTAGGMLREALDSLTPKGSSESRPLPSLVWVDLPCHADDFDQDDDDKYWSSLPQVPFLCRESFYPQRLTGRGR